ncbi:HEAT repeat domain-containing protein [Candidatus Poribacteria bacterium]|nr:HEAT repeat domain-containing protein [Candidatus Poribacteria bacterium]
MHQQKHNKFWRKWLTRWLINRLQTKSVEIRTYILQALGKVGDESALPAILNAAGDSNSTIRRFAVSALADLGDPRAVDALIGALNDSDTDIRAAAVTALGKLGDKRAENALIALLDDKVENPAGSGEISVRAQVVIALGHLRSHPALPLLKQMMATEANEWMRRYISQAIRDIEGGYFS